MKGKLRGFKRWKQGVLLLSIMTLLSGCFGSKPVLEELGKDGNGKLKILFNDEKWFFQEYGDAFTLHYPNIEIEVVETRHLIQQQTEKGMDYETALAQLIDEQRPDVLTLAPLYYEKFALDGKLYNIEPIIKQEQFDLAGYMPGLIDMMREQGSGTLYGLTPYFHTEVIYYNADVFKSNGIELPKSGMSWQELFDLAARFENTGMPGLYAGDEQADQMLYRVASTLSLQMFDGKGEHVRLESEGWKQAYTMVTDAIRTGALQTRKWGDTSYLRSENHLFLQGKAAMTISGSNLIHQLNDSRNKKASKMDWGIVPVPVDPVYPNETPSANAYEYFAIHAQSSNKRAAWEFVKYINSPEMAKASSSIYYKLPTRTGFVKSVRGKSTDPFYALQIKNRKHEYVSKRIPDEFNSTYAPLRAEALRSITANERTVDEALAELQNKAQAVLQQVRRKSSGK
ncbi:ABC transporter substrate-binding protein [Paenibacillus assamensis]|uniref:ABC transporter substrate-binding protein n=1 Tax=Paenibacillus assamensis TaxID=311244 RepID=UPI000421B590|nr:extracellular solute-binding protein [Paenibacillus assamensis]